MSFLKKPLDPEVARTLGASPDGGDFQVMFPALWEYLAFTQYPDGTPRDTATLMFMIQDGLWKAVLSDRASERVLWASSDEPMALLQGMEAALAGGTAEWRKKTPYPPPKRK